MFSVTKHTRSSANTMSDTETPKRVIRESLSVNVHHVGRIEAAIHRTGHAWINIGRTAFHFEDELDLLAFAERVLAAAKNPDRSND